jgi:hypothetical protein
VFAAKRQRLQRVCGHHHPDYQAKAVNALLSRLTVRIACPRQGQRLVKQCYVTPCNVWKEQKGENINSDGLECLLRNVWHGFAMFYLRADHPRQRGNHLIFLRLTLYARSRRRLSWSPD